MAEIIMLILILVVILAIGWLVKEIGPYLLVGAALYGGGIALWNYGQAFANNVKPERPAP